MAARKKIDKAFIPSIKDAIGKVENNEPLVKLKPEFRNTVPYAVKLKDPRWQKKRLEIFNRDNFTCRICGDTETTLAVHHLKYQGEPWDAPNEKLITVCEDCHIEIEELKSEINDFNTLKILKRKFKSELDRELYISFDESLRHKVYQLNGSCSSYIGIEKKNAERIINVLSKFIES
jgi:hypothetical protein